MHRRLVCDLPVSKRIFQSWHVVNPVTVVTLDSCCDPRGVGIRIAGPIEGIPESLVGVGALRAITVTCLLIPVGKWPENGQDSDSFCLYRGHHAVSSSPEVSTRGCFNEPP